MTPIPEACPKAHSENSDQDDSGEAACLVAYHFARFFMNDCVATTSVNRQ